MGEATKVDIEARIKVKIHKAVLEKDREKADSLKYLLSLLEKERLREGDLSEEKAMKILLGEMKRKKEALALFEKGDRHDLVEKEKREIRLLTVFLPEQASDEKIRAMVRAIIATEEKRDFGYIMGKIMEQLQGKADGAVVARFVHEEIG